MGYWEKLADRAYPGDWAMKAKGRAMDADRREAKIRTQIKSKQDEIFNLSLVLDSKSTQADRDRIAREIRDLQNQMYR